MPKSIPSVFKLIINLAVCFSLAGFMTSPAYGSKQDNFNSSVRIGYVPHPSLAIENGLASGSLANLVECSMAYFSRVEFVEMPGYSLMVQSLENNVIDIGLNMVKSKQRDQVAQYAFDLYKTRILLVGNEKSSNNLGAGVLGVKKGSEIDGLLLAKGYQVNTQAYSIYRLVEMYREGLINSFVDSEVILFDSLKSLDSDEVDFDYKALAEYAGGAYLANHFLERHPEVLEGWKKKAQSCAHHAPKIDS